MKGDGILESAEAAHALDNLTHDEIAANAQWIAAKSGAKVFGLVGIITVPSVWYLVKKNGSFARATGASGRVATAFIPALFAGTFTAEQTASRLANPGAYERWRTNDGKKIPLIRRFKQTVDKNPTGVLAGLSLPAVGGIFYLNSQYSHLTLSQRVLHTRVHGQFTVLSLLCLFGFYQHLVKEDEHAQELAAKVSAQP